MKRELAPEADETVCWQCGRPADPDCVYMQLLNAPSGRPISGQGFPVKQGRLQNAVRVPIPRCQVCQYRNWIATGLCVVAFFGGGALLGDRFPSHSGWAWPVGGFLGLGVVALGLYIYRRVAGLRTTGTYPPVRNLLASGWSLPG